MITILLEKIITILEGWLQSFTSHAQHVEDKLDSLDQTASDIKTNTDPISDIKDNTGAVITPIQNIKTNTDSIATSSQTSANNTTAILNNVSTLSTNTGRAAAFAEDCANNTLNILDKVTTIASDTTQIRANTAAIEDIKDLMQYYFINTIVTEDSEGVIANFDTDLEDYLQKALVTIPADPTGYTGITLTKCGKNLLSKSVDYFASIPATLNEYFLIKAGTYTFSISSVLNATSWRFNLRMKDKNGNNLSDTAHQPNNSFVWNGTVEGWINGTNTTATTVTFNIVEDCYIRITFSTGDTTAQTVFNDPILAVGNVATSYEAYKAMSYPVSFGSTITDGAEVDLLNGLVKVNTTPESYISITPSVIRTYKGVNNIFSDVGSTALTYRETLKKYLEKHNQ